MKIKVRRLNQSRSKLKQAFLIAIGDFKIQRRDSDKNVA